MREPWCDRHNGGSRGGSLETRELEAVIALRAVDPSAVECGGNIVVEPDLRAWA